MGTHNNNVMHGGEDIKTKFHVVVINLRESPLTQSRMIVISAFNINVLVSGLFFFLSLVATRPRTNIHSHSSSTMYLCVDRTPL